MVCDFSLSTIILPPGYVSIRDSRSNKYFYDSFRFVRGWSFSRGSDYVFEREETETHSEYVQSYKGVTSPLLTSFVQTSLFYFVGVCDLEKITSSRLDTMKRWEIPSQRNGGKEEEFTSHFRGTGIETDPPEWISYRYYVTSGGFPKT